MIIRLWSVGVVAALSATTALADSAEVVAAQIAARETGTERDHLTGDWGGVRTDLVDKGIHFSAAYVGETLANVEGGVKRGAIYEGLFEMSLSVDFERLGWLKDTSFHVSSIYPHGSSLTDGYVGDLLRLSNIDAYDSIRLYELWVERRFLSDRLSVRAGQVAADEEFATQEQGSLFLNSAHGWPAFISANVINGGPGFFVPGPGARVEVAVNDTLSLRAGVFDGDTFDHAGGNPRRNRAGTRVHFSSRQGLLMLQELSWKPGGGEDWTSGSYKLGGWVHTGDFNDLHDDISGNAAVVTGLSPKSHEGNFGVYAGAERLVWAEEKDADQGLGLFVRGGWSHPDRSYLDLVANGGLTWTGPFAGRGEDRVGLGLIYGRVSDAVRRSERADRDLNGSAVTVSDYEAAVELTWEAVLNKWWTIQPDVQWIIHPGGSTAVDNALVVGVRTTIVF